MSYFQKSRELVFVKASKRKLQAHDIPKRTSSMGLILCDLILQCPIFQISYCA